MIVFCGEDHYEIEECELDALLEALDSRCPQCGEPRQLFDAGFDCRRAAQGEFEWTCGLSHEAGTFVPETKGDRESLADPFADE